MTRRAAAVLAFVAAACAASCASTAPAREAAELAAATRAAFAEYHAWAREPAAPAGGRDNDAISAAEYERLALSIEAALREMELWMAAYSTRAETARTLTRAENDIAAYYAEAARNIEDGGRAKDK